MENELLVVIDLEATCWEEKFVPDQNEIIEIGLVVCDANGKIVDKFQSFVKPRINPILSPFCKKLTSIKQEWIDSASSLPVVSGILERWFRHVFSGDIRGVPWSSWGDFDRKCLQKDCERNGIEYFMGPHSSAKTMYAQVRGCKKMGVDEAAKREGLPFLGTHHRGIDDAINIASIIKSAKMAKILMESAVYA